MTIQVSPSVISSKTAEREAFLADLLSVRSPLSHAAPAWLTGLREQAAAIVQDQTLPTTRNEEWRFTDLSPLLRVQFESGEKPANLSLTEIQPFLVSEATSRLVFVDGVYAPDLSTIADLPTGVWIGNLSDVAATKPELQNYLAKQPGAEEVFTALNTAGLTDAAVVWVSKNQTVDPPIHVLFLATGRASTLIQPRCLVIAEANSQLTLIEEYVQVGQASSAYFTNAVTEIYLDTNAQVNHARVQRDGDAAFHIGKTTVTQARDSRYRANAVTLGASLSRYNPEVHQLGEQTETVLNGLTLIGGDQVADTHSTIAYTRPYGTSRQLHKCIVDDRAHAIFNGKVYVPKAAQLTDAGQLNRNLLLSPKARVDTKPQLEITADNVKCTHGAAVGQLDAEEVFYLQSRGLDKETAQKLLVYAFAIEIINQIPVASLREKLAATVSHQRSAASPDELIHTT